MKKLSVLILLLPFMAAAQKNYTISGNISGVKEPAKVYLAVVKNRAFVDTDSAVVKNGKFTLSGSVAEPTQAILTLKRLSPSADTRRRDYLAFFLENSAISIKSVDSIKNASVSGSVTDKEQNEVEAMIKPQTDVIIKLNDEFRGKPKDEAYKKASDSVTHLVAKNKAVYLNFAKSHLNSYMGLYVYHMNVLGSKFEPKEVGRKVFNQFSEELKSTELGKLTLEKIEAAERRDAGATATDFTQIDLNGNPFTLSSLRGKYVLVDFWASWCVPCRAENPNLVKAYQEMKDKNFEVVGVSLDQGKGAWEAAVKKDNLPWIHVSDLKGWKNAVAELYGVSSVPQNFLINPQGMIIAKNLRGENLTEQLKALIK